MTSGASGRIYRLKNATIDFRRRSATTTPAIRRSVTPPAAEAARLARDADCASGVCADDSSTCVSCSDAGECPLAKQFLAEY